MQGKLKQSYAPFGSVSTKKQRKKKNKQQLPGPGSYDIHLPIIAPIVQTIRKRNNNIIVKLGHLGTSSFLGSNSRFIHPKTTSSLGPGEYYPKKSEQQKSSMSPRQRKYAAERLHQLIKSPIQRHPTISQIKRIDFDDQVEMPSKEHVNKSRIKQNQVKGSVWSKMTEQRLSPDKNSSQNLGPGAYQIGNLLKQRKSLQKQPSSSFVSNSVRSFFDQIRFETNHDDKARKRQERNYKSDLVGPGSYQTSSPRKRSFNPYQFFGSTEERM